MKERRKKDTAGGEGEGEGKGERDEGGGDGIGRYIQKQIQNLGAGAIGTNRGTSTGIGTNRGTSTSTDTSTDTDTGGMGGIRGMELFKRFGAVEVGGPNAYKLLANGETVLLFPGGVREAYHKKGEEFDLFWPEKPDFVR